MYKPIKLKKLSADKTAYRLVGGVVDGENVVVETTTTLQRDGHGGVGSIVHRVIATWVDPSGNPIPHIDGQPVCCVHHHSTQGGAPIQQAIDEMLDGIQSADHPFPSPIRRAIGAAKTLRGK